MRVEDRQVEANLAGLDCCPSLPPTYQGGAEGETLRLARSMLGRGHAVDVVSVEYIDRGPEERVAWRDEVYQGVRIRRLSIIQALAPEPERWENDNPWVAAHLKQWMREIRPGVFHLVSGYLMTERELRMAHDEGIPSIATLTDYWFLCRRITMLRSDGALSTLPIDAAKCARCLGEEERRFRIPGKPAPGLMQAYWGTRHSRLGALRARNEFLAEALHGVDALVSPSEFLRTMYRQAGIGADDYVVIPHGPELPRLEPGQLNKTESPCLRVGYLGQIAWHKGVPVLMEAARQVDDPRLSVDIYGDVNRFPDYAARLNRLADADPRIRLAGSYAGQTEVAKVLQEVDIIVVPSIWCENCPNVILEAFAYRTPVAATRLLRHVACPTASS